eukprot:jgi/Mesvir1/14245/Mv09683-RA.1
MQSLAQLETLCERLYNSQDPGERSHAEQTLRVFSASPDYVSQCQYILTNSASPYAQLLAASSLVKLVTEHNLSVPQRLELRNFVLTYLFNNGPKLQPFVTTSLVQFLCRITKFGWFDDDRHRDITKEAMKFLSQGTQQHFFLGLKVLDQLVAEMNQPNSGQSLTQHRKTAVSFRDLTLSEIFQISLTSLRQLKTDATAEDSLREQAIQLALKCLSFDFVGTSSDESAEDLGTIQIPSPWRPTLEDPTTMQLFFDYYAAAQPPLSCQALECLVRLASVRRSLFTNEGERSKFLTSLMNGTREILRTQHGLDHHSNYHVYCRLLGRLKTNYQLSELVNVENYGEWIQLVAEFTIRSLQSWQWASGSVYYLLGLWSRLVSSMHYLKGDSPSLLEGFVPKITEVYITSRLNSVQAVLANSSAEDPLENEEQLQDQLDSLPYLCRFQYEKTSEFITRLWEPLLSTYSEMAGQQPMAVDSNQLQVLEGQLTWLVHIIGAVIRGRLSSSSADSQEVIDGDLASRVFQLIQIMDTGMHGTRYNEQSKQRLSIAILSFFQNFRKVYVGEQAMHSSKVYTRLSERLGLHDHLMVLNVIVGKIATNLKCYSHSELIELSLNLFQDLAAGYMSGKLLLKLEGINYILAHHTREHFPFLDDVSNSRNRTTFYATLGRLLFMEDTPAKFKAFMAPLQQVLVMLGTTPIENFRTDAVKFTLVGLLRDLRGIAISTNSRRTYGLLFDFMYPAHMPVLLRAAEVWTDTPAVTTPLLKFMAEFVLNKTQRLTFDPSSPNGILLFREISKLLLAYGTRALTLPPTSDPYTMKYKGIWICLSILTRALGGNYVNFGVFELYGDKALSDALDISLKLWLSIPLADIMAFRKVGKAYFALLEVLCHNHCPIIVSQDTNTFTHLITSIRAGLKSLDVSISSQCASAIDNLAAFYFNNALNQTEPITPAAAAMAKHLTEQPQLFPEILKTLFEIVLFEDCANQWSLSRPMLSLILINEQIFPELEAQLAASQPLERRQRLMQCFEKLMHEVSRSLEPKNRDKFTQNLTIFRHDFRAK